MKPLIISFSGGRTSAYMAKILIDKYKDSREILVLFANTGKERNETLDFVNACDTFFNFKTVWLESVQYHGARKSAGFKIVNYETANRCGNPFEDMIVKHGIPNKVFPHCSRELKRNPILSYLKYLKITNYEMAIGIRIDELKRATEKPKIIYPLISEFPSTKLAVNRWWFKQKFDLNLKEYEGNCDLCWKKSKRKLLTIISENPKTTEWWQSMEIKYENHVPVSQQAKRITPIHFFREDTSVSELLEDSSTAFVKATDIFTLADLMGSEPDLDFTDGCSESCEAF